MDAGVRFWRVLASEPWRDKLVTLAIARDIFSQKLLAFAAKATRFPLQGLVFAQCCMGGIGVEVLGPRERPNEKPGVLTARRSPLRAMPRCPAQPGSMSPDSETLSSRVEDRCHGGSVSTVVTAGKRYIRSRLRALKIGGSRERTPVRLRAKRNYDATQGSSMRPGQNNKRMRGRPNNRKGPNPLTRS